MERPSDLIQSVSRALRVLEAVGGAPEGLSPKVVARRTGLALSTAYHLLRTLSYEGYLRRLPSGDYALGLEIADRFRDLAGCLARPPAVSAALRHLARSTSFSAYLARFVDGRVTITHVVEAPRSPPLEDLVPGFDEAAHATALGKALLSRLTTRARRDYLAQAGLRPFTSQTVRDSEALESEIAGTARGLYREACQFRDGVACAAMVVATGRADDPWWALAIGGEVEQFARRRRALEVALRAAATDLEVA